MSNYKYLSDGRKVVVIGQLNNTESIVQEVFITPGGDEIPSGERFVTKSLHDEPVKSWAEKQKEKHQAALERIKQEQDRENKRIIDIRQKLKGYQETFKQVKKLAETLPEETLEELAMFMSGSVEYVVVASRYELVPPKRFDEEIFYYDRHYDERRFDGVSLVTFLGKSDGNTQFTVSRWNDGSGSEWRSVKPFADWNSALAYFKKLVESKLFEGKFSLKDYETCKKAGIDFTAEQMARIEEIVIGAHRKNLANAEASAAESVKKAKERLEQAQDKLRDIG